MSWVMTYSGVKFDLFKPKIDQVRLIDIAHSLANQCRFNGHCDRFYSVAEHSVYVSYFAGAEGLMHDAAEAYIGDITGPLKQFIREKTDLIEYTEHYILKLIFEKFCLKWPISDLVWDYDLRMCLTEGRALGFDTSEWEIDHVAPIEIGSLSCMKPSDAKNAFLSRAGYFRIQ